MSEAEITPDDGVGRTAVKTESKEPLEETDIADMPEVPEVALLLWILLSSVKFKMSHFTLGALESGLRNPSVSDVMACTHTILLLDDAELEGLRRSQRGHIRKDFDWWTGALYSTVRSWVENRRDLAADLRNLEESDDAIYDEDLVEWHKANVAELDELLEPILLGPVPTKLELEDVEEKESEDNCESQKDAEDKPANDCTSSPPSSGLVDQARPKESKKERRARLSKLLKEREDILVDQVLPFRGADGYLCISPAKRLALLRAVCVWRANGHPEPSVLETVRAFDPDSLRQPPLGFDNLGRRYWYFPQFFRDCRVYRETFQDEADLLAEEDKAKEERRKVDEAKAKRSEQEEVAAAANAAATSNGKQGADQGQDQLRSGRKGRGKRAKNAEREPSDANQDEEMAKRLEAESTRRVSSRRRVEVQRFDKEQAEHMLAQQNRKRGSKVAAGESDAEDEGTGTSDRRKRPAVDKGRKSAKGKASKRRRVGGGGEEADGGGSESATGRKRRPAYDGPELPPKKWELVVRDLESLRGLIAQLQAVKPKSANEDLIYELEEIAGHVEKEEDNIRKAQARADKLERMQAVPRKRSGRVEAIEEKKKQREDEDRERREAMEALAAERRERRRLQEEERKARERERRIAEREAQKQFEEQQRVERLEAREQGRMESFPTVGEDGSNALVLNPAARTMDPSAWAEQQRLEREAAEQAEKARVKQANWLAAQQLGGTAGFEAMSHAASAAAAAAVAQAAAEHHAALHLPQESPRSGSPVRPVNGHLGAPSVAAAEGGRDGVTGSSASDVVDGIVAAPGSAIAADPGSAAAGLAEGNSNSVVPGNQSEPRA